MAVEQLGQALVEIVPDTRGFGREAAQGMEKELGPAADRVNDKVGSGMAGALKKVGAAVAAAGVGAFFKSAVSAATDTAEQVSKVGVVFGDASESVLDFADNATEGIGASKLEALEATATFGNLLRSVGLSGQAAADMSTDMTQLAGDLASFNNVPVGDALEAIRSGLVGETEPLKKFGVNLNEAALKAEAMALGLDVSGTSLNATTKAQAAYSLIMKQTALAQGDLARTSDSLANQQRILSAEFQNAKAEVGEALAPAMLQLVKTGRDLMPVLVTVAETVAMVGAAVGPVVSLLGKLAGTEVGQVLVTVGLAAGGVALAYAKLQPAITAVTGFLAAQAAAHGATATAAAAEAAAVGISTGADMAQAAASTEAATANLAQAGAATASGTAATNAIPGIGKLASTMSGAVTAVGGMGPVAVAAAAAVAIGALAFRDWRNASKELAEQQAKVDKALLDAGDPAAVLATEYTKMQAALEKVVEVGEQVATAKGREAVATELLTDALGPHQTALGSLGQTNESVREAVLKGGDAFDQLLQSMIPLGDVTGDQRERLYNLSGALQTVEQDLRDSTHGSAEAVKQTLELAVSQGELEQAELDRAKATAGTTEADVQWLAAGQQLEPQMRAIIQQRAIDAAGAEAQAAAQQASIEAVVAAVDPTAKLAAKQKELAAAEDEVKEATDAAKEAQDAWLSGVLDYQAGVDDTTEAVRNMRKITAEMSEEDVRAALAGETHTESALKLRDAFQNVASEAVDVVDNIGKTSATAEIATQRTAEYAQQQYDLAVAYGVPEAEAAKIRDTILTIPSSHPSTIDVAQHGAEVAKAEIASAAADQEAVINVTWKQQNLGVMNAAREAFGLPIISAAQGGVVRHRRGGTLALIGEGGADEAVVPLGSNFAADLARIVGPRMMGQLGTPAEQQGPTLTISVNIANAPGNAAEASQLGRVVGETAAQVLAQRQLAAAVRVG